MNFVQKQAFITLLSSLKLYTGYMENIAQKTETQIEQERLMIMGQNRADFLKMKEESEEIRRELDSGKLSKAAENELRERQELLVQGMTLLRDSVNALAESEAILVSEPEPLYFEVADESKFLHDKYMETLNELESLKIERDSLFDMVSGERLQSALRDIDARIQTADSNAEMARISYENKVRGQVK
jgi:hypothetical protein